MNRSRLGVIPSTERDASPRIILEFMAAGLPVLANSAMCGAAKYILPGAGRLAPMSEFKSLIPEMLSACDGFSSYEVFQDHFSPRKVALDFAGHVRAVMEMPEKPPRPSWRGRLARLLRLRVDAQIRKINR